MYLPGVAKVPRSDGEKWVVGGGEDRKEAAKAAPAQRNKQKRIANGMKKEKRKEARARGGKAFVRWEECQEKVRESEKREKQGGKRRGGEAGRARDDTEQRWGKANSCFLGDTGRQIIKTSLIITPIVSRAALEIF